MKRQLWGLGSIILTGLLFAGSVSADPGFGKYRKYRPQPTPIVRPTSVPTTGPAPTTVPSSTAAPTPKPTFIPTPTTEIIEITPIPSHTPTPTPEPIAGQPVEQIALSNVMGGTTDHPYRWQFKWWLVTPLTTLLGWILGW